MNEGCAKAEVWGEYGKVMVPNEEEIVEVLKKNVSACVKSFLPYLRENDKKINVEVFTPPERISIGKVLVTLKANVSKFEFESESIAINYTGKEGIELPTAFGEMLEESRNFISERVMNGVVEDAISSYLSANGIQTFYSWKDSHCVYCDEVFVWQTGKTLQQAASEIKDAVEEKILSYEKEYYHFNLNTLPVETETSAQTCYSDCYCSKKECVEHCSDSECYTTCYCVEYTTECGYTFVVNKTKILVTMQEKEEFFEKHVLYDVCKNAKDFTTLRVAFNILEKGEIKDGHC